MSRLLVLTAREFGRRCALEMYEGGQGLIGDEQVEPAPAFEGDAYHKALPYEATREAE